MARICPQCGAKAIDDQSAFCNKCGTPFPADQPRKVLVRTAPRLADPVPVQPPPQQPAAAPGAGPEPVYTPPPPSPARSYAEPARVRAPVPARNPASGPQPFRRLVARGSLKAMYWLGVIAILLIVFSGIMADSAKDPAAPPEDTAGAAKESPPDLLSAIPLFWIGIFVLANLSWRVMCETCAVVLSRPDLPCAPLPMETPAAAPLLEDMAPAVGAGEPGGSVECPRCGKVVPSGEQKTCEICGVQGCSSCIRLMGLLKKKWTCRDCFEQK